MKKADAQINLSIDVECPYCDSCLDLTTIQSLCDDGYIYNKAFDDGTGWGCDRWEEEVVCPDCNEKFIVENILW